MELGGRWGGLDVVRTRLLRWKLLHGPFLMEHLWFAERSTEQEEGTSEGGRLSFGLSLINTPGGSGDRPSFTAVT